MKSNSPLRIISTTHRPAIVESDEMRDLKAEMEALRAKVPQPKESATEIAARLRAGQPPKRALIWRETIDGGRG